MNKKHYLCTHTWIGEKEKLESLAATEGMTVNAWFDPRPSAKAECRQHWMGQDDFFFCHWFAESEEAILEALDQTGSNDRIVTAAYETPRFVSKNALTGKPVINPFSNILLEGGNDS
jgi:hypothetical protein